MLIQFLPKNHAMHLMILKYLMKNETRLIWNKKDLVHFFFWSYSPFKIKNYTYYILITYYFLLTPSYLYMRYMWGFAVEARRDQRHNSWFRRAGTPRFNRPIRCRPKIHGHPGEPGAVIRGKKVRTHTYITNIHETCIYSFQYPKCLHMKFPFSIKNIYGIKFWFCDTRPDLTR